ncbi:MAG: hypothetical protein M0Z29_09290 [Actinomycetota bacterium]|nr:hypothetical protein [Actinomycetota bacterium]
MSMRRFRTAAFFLASSAGLAACGYGASASPGSSAGGATKGSGVKLTVESSKYGKVLALSNGETLYMFSADTSTTSKCIASCTGVWPPVAANHVVAGTGVQSASLGTISRGSGPQLTYDGHPLYTYVGDTSAGAVTGEGINAFGGLWYVVSSGGTPVKPSSSSGSTSGSSSGSYGGSTSGSSSGGY